MSGQRTVLFDTHQALGAKMVEFGGWEMPVQYTGILDEHRATRTAAGLFDTCHMGEVTVEGPGAAEFLDRVITRRIRDMAAGECRYGLICNKDAGIIDDCIAFRRADERFLVVINAGTREGDVQHLRAHLPESGVTMTDVSDRTGKIDLQGPKAREILSPLTGADLGSIEYFHFAEDPVAGVPTTISRTGYTGEPGYELYMPADRAAELWNALLDAGGDAGLKPCGLGSRDTLRLEACLPLYGSDLSTGINPYEAGLGWCVRSKKKGLIGGRALQEIRSEGPTRHLAAFRMDGRAPARHGHAVFAPGSDEAIGEVTSGSFCPTVNAAVGLALLKTGHEKAGGKIEIEIRGKRRGATVAAKPFYRNEEIQA